MYPFFRIRHLFLILPILIFIMPLPSHAEDDWTGTWYAAGMRLMEIKKLPNGKYVSEIKEEYARIRAMVDMEGIEHYRHAGTVNADGELVFADFEAVPSKVFAHYGVKSTDPSGSTVALLKELEEKSPFGRYYEKWRLDDQLRIEIISSFPHWVMADFSEGSIDNAKKWYGRMSLFGDLIQSPKERKPLLQEFQEDNGGAFHQVFAWKITDADELKGWEYFEEDAYSKAVESFTRASVAQPDSPFSRIACAWAAIGTKDFDLARSKVKEARGLFNDDSRSALEGFSYFLEYQIASYETQALHPDQNIYAFTKRLPDHSKHLYNQVESLLGKDIGSYSDADYLFIENHLKSYPAKKLIKEAIELKPRGGLCELGQNLFDRNVLTTGKGANVPDFQKSRLLGLSTVLYGHRELKSGNLKAAIDAYVSVVRYGRSLRHDFLIMHLLGMANEQDGLIALEHIYENPELMKAPGVEDYLLEAVVDITAEKVQPPLNKICAYEVPMLQSALTSDPLLFSVNRIALSFNYRDVLIRSRLNEAHAALLEAAARIETLKDVNPETIAQIELPEDPFAKDTKIGVAYTENTVKLYSVGPDGVSQGGKVHYNQQANGDNSGGDIVVTLYGIK